LQFLPLDYGVVADVLERVWVAGEHAQDVDLDALITISHYIRMLRRRIVSDPVNPVKAADCGS